jgi:hypothetical protein
MVRPRVRVGIDVGGVRKGFHAVALREEGWLDTFATLDAEAMARWCRDVDAWAIGIDAPCSKRTARYTQVTEVVRRAFQLRPKGTAALRQNLKEIYRLRDLAVHPSGKIEAPILHPELTVGVGWRFAYFRAHNAEIVVNAATWILWDLAHNGKPGDTKIREYLGSLRQRLAAAFPNGHPTAAIAAPPP